MLLDAFIDAIIIVKQAIYDDVCVKNSRRLVRLRISDHGGDYGDFFMPDFVWLFEYRLFCCILECICFVGHLYQSYQHST
jgi:hypothetical protein